MFAYYRLQMDDRERVHKRMLLQVLLSPEAVGHTQKDFAVGLRQTKVIPHLSALHLRHVQRFAGDGWL